MRRRNIRRTRKRSHSPWLLHSVNRPHSKERPHCWQRIALLCYSICIIMGTNRTGWLKEHAVGCNRISTSTFELYRTANWNGKYGSSCERAVSENYTADCYS